MAHDPLESFRLDGKAAVVTGGARGIGAACARTLGAAGAAVLVTDILEDAGRATAEELGREGIRAAFAAHDVRTEERGVPRRRGRSSCSAGWTCWSTTPASRSCARSPTRRSRTGAACSR